MDKLLTIIFGHPDLNKIGLAIRGFFFALAASSVGALLYLLNQWANNYPIDWLTAKQIFVYNVVPTLTIWFTALKTWLNSQSSVAIDDLNKMLNIAIKLPHGATPEDVKAIYEHTENQQ